MLDQLIAYFKEIGGLYAQNADLFKGLGGGALLCIPWLFCVWLMFYLPYRIVKWFYKILKGEAKEIMRG